MPNMTDEQKQFYRIKAALQELFGMLDEDLVRDKELDQYLNLSANIALQQKTLGPKRAYELRLKRRGLRLVPPSPHLRVVKPPNEPDPT